MVRFKITKIISTVLLSAIILSGCTTDTIKSKSPSNSKTLTISASFYPIYIFLLNISMNIPNIKVVNMTKPIIKIIKISKGEKHDS